MNEPELPPIQRSLSVSWGPEAAFRRFTGEFASWWPSRTHSIGGERLTRIVFEAVPGGRIYEEHEDGRRFQWGEVLAVEPPRRVSFTWHPSREPATAQEVVVDFEPSAGGTRVTLTSSHWERWGEGAKRAHRGYDIGWGYVLNVFAGRRTASMALLDAIAGVLGVVQRFRGGQEAVIAKARGEIPAA